jgi:predicted GNAT family acetyltransferase
MQIEVTNDAEASRYELRLDGRLVGIADYRTTGTTVVFSHTEIDPPLRGRGLGAELVRAALDDVRAAGLTVVPLCWYVAQYIDEHPKYADLLAA